MGTLTDRISMTLIVATGLFALLGYILAYRVPLDSYGVPRILLPGVAAAIALSLLVVIWLVLDRYD